jgi:hypothetical protein
MIDNDPDLTLLFKLALESAGLFYSKLTHLITLRNALFNCISGSYDLVTFDINAKMALNYIMH